MQDLIQIGMLLLGFAIIAVSSNQLARLFMYLRLPLISGLLIIGILAGPFVLDLIPKEATTRLNFINQIALAFIAFAAGAELYLKEMVSRIKAIRGMTIGQVVGTFFLGAVGIYIAADYIPFLAEQSMGVKIAVAMLGGIIFVASSPASVIAVINEVRAKGPFTQTAIGVTVFKDFVIIIMFSIGLAIAEALVSNVAFTFFFVLILLLEIAASFFLGYVLFLLLKLVLQLSVPTLVKTFTILMLGYLVYFLGDLTYEYSKVNLPFEIYSEPLLVCIVASFLVTNYSAFRPEFSKILNETGPIVYVAFFTLTGASISLDVLFASWTVALLLFGIRLLSLFLGSFAGGFLGGDPLKWNQIAFMPYITQAGVSLGLVTLVAAKFPAWGGDFLTVIVAVIVLNQIVGPPLFKWALNFVGEGHAKGKFGGDSIKKALIFGLEGQSLALAKQLFDHGWKVEIASTEVHEQQDKGIDTPILHIPDYSRETLTRLGAANAEAIVMMLSDDENYQICETAYENFGTKDLVVRLNNRLNFERFHKLGALIVEPTTAIVSLLDHFVRSPQATSLLMGMEKGQEALDLEVVNPNLHGMALRNLRLPTDVIILSIQRRGQAIISHGYTRLRLGDVVTMVGSVKSLESVTLRFED